MHANVAARKLGKYRKALLLLPPSVLGRRWLTVLWWMVTLVSTLGTLATSTLEVQWSSAGDQPDPSIGHKILSLTPQLGSQMTNLWALFKCVPAPMLNRNIDKKQSIFSTVFLNASFLLQFVKSYNAVFGELVTVSFRRGTVSPLWEILQKFQTYFTVTEEWRALGISVLKCSEFFSNLMHLILFRWISRRCLNGYVRVNMCADEMVREEEGKIHRKCWWNQINSGE